MTETTRPYQICTNCIMDTSDPTITFDERGFCDYCQNYYQSILPHWHPNEKGEALLQPLIAKIKEEGKGKEHDCLIGISGGLDSSYVAHVAVSRFGLRPLMFHCDTGWNSDLGVSNIQKIIEGLNLDLHTEVVNWEEMKDLQIAFFKSCVPTTDTPQDLALFSAIYNYARANGFKYIITGGNHSTEVVRECIDWTYFSTDMRQVNDIHRKFGTSPLKTFPRCDILKYKLVYRWVYGIQVVKMLDSVPYLKQNAIRELEELYGWQPYPMKHYESRFTRFFESYWTPKKFGFDKRRAYFSSEILTEQMTRTEALDRIGRPELTEETMAREFEYVAKKLGLTVQDLRDIFNSPNRSFRDYANNYSIIMLGAKVQRLLGMERRAFR